MGNRGDVPETCSSATKDIGNVIASTAENPSNQKPDQPKIERMKEEKARLESFPHCWAESAVSKEDVAKAGMYYIGPGDRVRCAFCMHVLKDWEKGDEPELEHKKFSPDCPRLKICKPASIPHFPIQEVCKRYDPNFNPT